MRSITLALLLALVALQYKLWFGDGSIKQLHVVEKQLLSQEAMNDKLASRNHALEADITELKSGEQALEEHARFELGMVKRGEVYYQFVE